MELEFNGVKPKVYICIPNGGNLVTELAMLLIKLTHQVKYDVQIYTPKNLFPLDNARNHCVKKFLESDCTHIWWIDDDIVPPENALDKLLASDKDAITAAAFAVEYKTGTLIPYPVTLRYNEDKKYQAYFGNGKGEIEQIDATGGACVLVKRHVYEAIERPYEFQYHRDGTLSLTCDFDIWQKAKAKGFELWADWSIVCSHYKECDIKMINDVLIKVTEEKDNGTQKTA